MFDSRINYHMPGRVKRYGKCWHGLLHLVDGHTHRYDPDTGRYLGGTHWSKFWLETRGGKHILGYEITSERKRRIYTQGRSVERAGFASYFKHPLSGASNEDERGRDFNGAIVRGSSGGAEGYDFWALMGKGYSRYPYAIVPSDNGLALPVTIGLYSIGVAAAPFIYHARKRLQDPEWSNLHLAYRGNYTPAFWASPDGRKIIYENNLFTENYQNLSRLICVELAAHPNGDGTYSAEIVSQAIIDEQPSLDTETVIHDEHRWVELGNYVRSSVEEDPLLMQVVALVEPPYTQQFGVQVGDCYPTSSPASLPPGKLISSDNLTFPAKHRNWVVDIGWRDHEYTTDKQFKGWLVGDDSRRTAIIAGHWYRDFAVDVKNSAEITEHEFEAAGGHCDIGLLDGQIVTKSYAKIERVHDLTFRQARSYWLEAWGQRMEVRTDSTYREFAEWDSETGSYGERPAIEIVDEEVVISFNGAAVATFNASKQIGTAGLDQPYSGTVTGFPALYFINGTEAVTTDNNGFNTAPPFFYYRQGDDLSDGASVVRVYPRIHSYGSEQLLGMVCAIDSYNITTIERHADGAPKTGQVSNFDRKIILGDIFHPGGVKQYHEVIENPTEDIYRFAAYDPVTKTVSDVYPYPVIYV